MIRRRTLSLLITICLGHVLLISAQVPSKRGLPVIEELAFGVSSSLHASFAHIARAVRSVWTSYFALSDAARENEALNQRILALEAEVQHRLAEASRVRTLEEVLALRSRLDTPTLAAEVIAGNPTPGFYTVTIDRGAEDGLRPDLAVVGARGVVGRVIGPIARHAATVQLLIDRLAALAVVFEGSGAGGIVVGTGTDRPLRAQYVPVLADIQAGERVVTSGQDGIYPPGFLVGTVERVERAEGAERQILVRPATDFSHVDVVLVLLTPTRPVASLP